MYMQLKSFLNLLNCISNIAYQYLKPPSDHSLNLLQQHDHLFQYHVPHDL